MDNRLESASRKSFALDSATLETLVIYCADPRFRAAFEKFVRTELGIKHHALLSLAGGIGSFVQFAPDAVEATPMADQLRVFVASNSIKTVVVVAHTDCRWYAQMNPDDDSDSIKAKQISDLQKFAQMIRTQIAGASVTTYLAVSTDENIGFKIVPTS